MQTPEDDVTRVICVKYFFHMSCVIKPPFQS